MKSIHITRVGSIAIVIITAFALFANQAPVRAEELPFDLPTPPTGTDVLCYINNLEEVAGTEIHPPLPTFDVGDCENTSPPPPPSAACSNEIDDDGDGFTDADDPNCHTDGDLSNSSSYDPNISDESGALPACWNGADDDGDGKTDFPNDPGCSSATDTDEADDEGGGGGSTPVPQCSDGVDNDGDGLLDLDDPGCSDGNDNDETNSSGGGITTGSGSSRGGGGGGSIATTSGIVLGFSTTTESCDRYLTAFIRDGQENDVDQVKRLQRFLRDFEEAPVEESGVYDATTLAAVHALQSKYAADILTPWGIEESTGYVYLTTRKKVNEIFCGYTKIFYLTVDEQNKIEEARAGALVPTEAPLGEAPSVPSAKPASQGASAAVSGTSTDSESAMGDVFDFLKRIFYRAP